MLLEAVSEPLQGGEHAAELSEAFEEVFVVFVTHDESFEILQSADGAFDLPASLVPTQRTTVLAFGPLAILAMRRDQLHITINERIAKPVGVGRFIVDEPERHAISRMSTSVSIVWTSATLAATVKAKSGVPSPSIISWMTVPLPRFVRPTPSPPFWRAQTCHRPSLRPS